MRCCKLVSVLLLSWLMHSSTGELHIPSFLCVLARSLVPPDPALYRPAPGIFPFSTLSPGQGHPLSTALFASEAQGVSRTSYCQLEGNTFFPDASGARFPRNDAFRCLDSPPDGDVCLTREEIAAAFASQPEVHQSLYARYDLPPLRLESQGTDVNEFTSQVFALLASEVGGYRVSHALNLAFRTSLLRCIAGEFDLHMELWRSDWSDDEWNGAFLGTDHAVEQTCEWSGASGLSIFNGFWADTFSVVTAANNSTIGASGQPISLDFWRTYTTAEGVAGLPAPNFTDVAVNPGDYFVPPLCDPAIPDHVPCGVMFVVSRYFEPGIVQAQVVNLQMRLVLYFPPDPSTRLFFAMVTERVQQGEQVLFMVGSLNSFVSSPYYTHVQLPTVSPECIADISDPRGPVEYDCDFRHQLLNKMSYKNANSDYADAYTLFKRAQFSSELVSGALATLTDEYHPPDAACQWIRDHPATWTPWFTKTTPRVRVLELGRAQYIAILVLCGLYAVFTLAAMAFLYVHRAHSVVRRASYLFCQIILAGACVFYATLVVGVQRESESTCVSAQFLFSAAFSLFYGSLLFKTLRIYFISCSKNLQRRTVPDATLLAWLAVFGAVDLMLVGLWTAVSPPEPTLVTNPAEPYTRIRLCSSEFSDQFRLALYVWRGLAVLAGGVLSIRVRGVDDDFSESKFLGACCYNIIVVSVPVVGLTLIGSRDPDISALSWLVGVSLAVFGSSLIFLAPKRRAFLEYSSRMYTVSSVALSLAPDTKQRSEAVSPAAVVIAPAAAAAAAAPAANAVATFSPPPHPHPRVRDHPVAAMLQSHLPSNEGRSQSKRVTADPGAAGSGDSPPSLPGSLEGEPHPPPQSPVADTADPPAPEA